MVLCIGGEEIIINEHKIHVFKNIGTAILNVITGGDIELLVVAGGGIGDGSNCEAGGGGAGGLIYKSNFNILSSDINVIVGSGGTSGNKGNNSIFGSLIAEGGGGSNGAHGGGGRSGFISRNGSNLLSGINYGETNIFEDVDYRIDTINNCKYKNTKCLRGVSNVIPNNTDEDYVKQGANFGLEESNGLVIISTIRSN